VKADQQQIDSWGAALDLVLQPDMHLQCTV